MRFSLAAIAALVGTGKSQMCGLFDDADGVNPLGPDNDLSIVDDMILCTNVDGTTFFPICRGEFIENCIDVDCNGSVACRNTTIDGASHILCRNDIDPSSGACSEATMMNIMNDGLVECIGQEMCFDAAMNSSGATDDVAFNVICDGRDSCSGAEIEAGLGIVVCKNGGSGSACTRQLNVAPVTISARCLICGIDNGCNSDGECLFAPFTDGGVPGPAENCPPSGSFAGDCTTKDFCDVGEVPSPCMVFAELQAEDAQLESDFNELDNDMNSLNETVIGLQDEVNSLNDTNTQLQALVDKLNGTLNGLENELNAVNDTNAKLNSQVEKLERELNSVNDTTTELKVQVEGLEEDANNLNETNAVLEREVRALNDTNAEQQEKIDDLEGDLRSLNDTNAKLLSLVDNANETVSGLETKVGALNGTNAEQQVEIDKLQSEIDTLKEMVTSLNLTIVELVRMSEDGKSSKSSRRLGN